MQDQPRRLRSAAVSLGLVGALALSLSACGTPSASATRRCIDETNIRVTDQAYPVVGDDQCIAAPSTSGSFGTTSRYRYYYGGRLNSGYVSGGSFTIPANYRSSSSSSRRWYNPGTWRSSSNSSSSSSSSASSGSSSSTKSSGVSTGGFGSSGSSGGKSGSSSS